ncbi:MAG TPA: hypothetical protein VF723_12045 [Pyrinomonadaceae bacterium]|jgi:hypothetical protein
MTGKKRKLESVKWLDQVGREVVRASVMNDTEAAAAASSPFLYARLRSRIEAERERRETGESWLALLGVVWRSAPAMALVAVFAFVLFWSASIGTRPPAGFSDEALLGERDTGIERVVFAGTNAPSSDEVLATILNGDEREAAK